MKKNILSEVNRTREIMGLTILEQNISIGKTIVSGEKETFTAGKPIIITMDKEATYGVNQDDPKKVIMPFYNELLEKLKEVLGDNLKTDVSGLKLVSAEIDSGASNFYNRKPTLADVANDRKTPLPTQWWGNEGWGRINVHFKGVCLQSALQGIYTRRRNAWRYRL